MNPTENWKALFKTPGPPRTAMVVMLVTWGLAAIWGWFVVEPTVLRDSQTARDFVDFSIKIFPWLENIRKLGPQAEKGLFLHSAYTFALAPVSVGCSLATTSHPEAKERGAKATVRDGVILAGFCFALLLLGIFGMYSGILQQSFGQLHRTGYSFVVSSFTVPVVAPFFIMGLWHALTGGIHFAYFSVCKLSMKE
jgi:hypothetical protein